MVDEGGGWAKGEGMKKLLLGMLMTGVGMAADWPQWLGADRDGTWYEAGVIAERTAKVVAKELDFPGRIRITVIRETRTTAFAD